MGIELHDGIFDNVVVGVDHIELQVLVDDLLAGARHHYTFSIRGSETNSTTLDQLLIRIVVSASSGSALTPAVPTISELVPLASQANSSQAQALFGIQKEGLYVLAITGIDEFTAGAYELQISIAGDTNADGTFNIADAIAVLVESPAAMHPLVPVLRALGIRIRAFIVILLVVAEPNE